MAVLDLSPGKLDIIGARQGSRILATVTFTDQSIDFAGYLARMKVRRWAEDTTDPLLDLSTSGVGLVWVSRAVGSAVLTLDVSAVLMADVPAGDWAHDLELVPPGSEAHARAFWAGRFQVDAEVTR